MSGGRNNVDAFDAYAVDFDETVGSSPVVQELRRRIYEIIRERVSPGGRILDINCGTGTDCRALASIGYRTLGVDLSPAMIQRARTKVVPGADMRFDVLPFDHLNELEQGSFDLVLSNNSGLNCARDLGAVLKDVHAALRPGGFVVAVVMPPFSLWEALAGLCRFDLAYAMRRGRHGTANIGGRPVEVWYHGEGDLRHTAGALFDVELVLGLNIVAPPPNSLRFVQRLPGISGLLSSIDRSISPIPILRKWGDQILIVMRKRGS